MKFCNNCGASMEDTAMFCQTCGASCRNADSANTYSENNTVIYSNVMPPQNGINPQPDIPMQPQKNTALYSNVMPPQNNINPQPYIPMQPQKKKLSTGMIVLIIVLSVFFLIGICVGVGAFIYGSLNSDEDTFGYVENGKYTNSYAGLEFYAPSDNWSFLTKDEIFYYYYDDTDDYLFDEATEETYSEFADGYFYYDMVLQNTETEKYVRFALTSEVDYTVDEYISLLESNLVNMYDKVTFESEEDVILGDNVYTVRHADTLDGDVTYRQYYAVSMKDNRLLVILVTVKDLSFGHSFDDFIRNITANGSSGYLSNEDTFGYVENGKYTNNFAGLELHVPSADWNFLTMDEIIDFYSRTVEDLYVYEKTKEIYTDYYDSYLYYDMVIRNTVTKEAVEFSILNDADCTIDEFFSRVEYSSKNTYDEVTFKSEEAVTLGDNVYTVECLDIVYKGVIFRQYYAATIKDNRLLYFCVTVKDLSMGDNFKDYISNFTEIGE